MKRLWMLIASLAAFTAAPLNALPTPCGQQTACDEGQRCCQHVVATFCKDATCGYAFQEGQCVPSNQACDEFWCGSQRCQSNWFSAKNVCCVYHDPSGADNYACSSSELSCRGNNQRLSIRPQNDKESG